MKHLFSILERLVAAVAFVSQICVIPPILLAVLHEKIDNYGQRKDWW